MEIKAISRVPAQFKGLQDRRVTGLFSIMGNIDSTNDIVWPQAFATARADKLLGLWQHDFESPPTFKILNIREIGRSELPQTIRVAYPEATGGLQAEREFLPTPRGDEILAAIKADVPLGASFGFNARQFDYSKGPDGTQIRNLRGVELLELSDVLWGANSAAVADVGAGTPKSTRAWLAATGLELAALQLDLLTAGLPAPAEQRAPALSTLRQRLAAMTTVDTRARSRFERK